MKCSECECVPNANNEKFYHVRTSDNGLRSGDNLADRTMCEECVEYWIDTNGDGFDDVVSIIRIENPLAVTDQ